jgi:predicted phosphodiesterase
MSEAVKLGLISDVHGNRVALDAVLVDGRGQDVDAWWALGDLVAIGPDPVPTLELLTSVPDLQATRGNTDRYVASGDRPPPYPDEVAARPELLGQFAAVEGSFAWTRGALASHGWLDWLTELPLECRTTLPDGTRVLGVHASPGRDDGAGITPDRPEPELQAALAGAAADLVCAGHTHRPTDRQIGLVHAVNLGSVSNPITDDLRASYVIIHADRHGHHVEHRRVAYDHAAVLERVARSGHPSDEYLASFQRGERIQFTARQSGAPGFAVPLPG